MKQFLTLCMATAMLGTTLNVDAKLSYERAMQLKSEGKVVAPRFKTRSNKAIKNLSQAPASRFHKLMDAKAVSEAKRLASAKAPAKDDQLYGYLGYTVSDEQVPGLFHFTENAQTMVWADEFFEEYMATPSGLGLSDGVLKGYCLDTFWGMIFGIYYLEYDFNTGEVLSFQEQNIDESINYIQQQVLDTDTETIYGYGGYDGEFAFIKASTEDPFDYSYVAPASNACMSMCYNPLDKQIYGVTTNYEFVTVDKNTGEMTTLMQLDVEDGATYITGLTYNPKSDLFYWNINRNDDTSAMATIDLKTKTLDVYEELYNCEEYLSLMTTDEVFNPYQPGRPVAGAADFYKDNHIGFATFTLPTEMADGTPITADKVSYRTFINGEIYYNGSAAPGSEVKVNFAVDGDGMYTFGMAAVMYDDNNQPQQGKMATMKVYVGNDEPLAPTNVKLSAAEVSWDAVTSAEGVHGGYVDTKTITYNVFVNGEPVATDLIATSCASKIDTDADLEPYTATVVAVCNGHESKAGSSNSIVEGAPLALPVEIEPTEEQYAISSIYDANEDGSTWGLAVLQDESYALYSGWNSTNLMDDYYFLPPVVLDDPSKFYTFSMEIRLRGAQYSNEYVEVLLCNEPSVNGITSVIMDEFSPEGENYELASEEFKIRQPGTYYIALHCTSEPDQYGVYVRNLSVADNNITLESPAKVDDLDLEETAKGKLEATASFTLPTETFGGEALDASSDLIANLSCGDNTASVSGKPGETVSTTIATAQGNNQVYVTVSLGDLNSPVAVSSVYTGVTVPASPVITSSEVSADNLSLTFTWDPVTNPEDEANGYVDPSDIVYDIYRVEASIFGSMWVAYDEGITDTSYTYYEDAEQTFVQLGVVARNAAGDNGYVTSTTGVVGPVVALPIIEDFDAGGFNTQPWVIYDETPADSESPEAGLYYSSAFGDYSSETVCLAVLGSNGSKGMLGTPKFSTKGCDAVTATFEVNGDFEIPTVKILAQVGSGEITEIAEIAQPAAGFHNVSVEVPAEFLGQDVVGLFIGYEFEAESQVLVIESLSIEKGTGVASIAAKNVKIAGGKGAINVTGLNGENVIVADLNGRVVAKSAKAVKEVSFQLEQGVYVVEAGDKKAKVVVK
ncbi:MAG: hypothetical protein Q4C37_09825 [Bacteroidales bacterium]|nr:hypothetical protein [Bacteroidales bacterium]